MGKTKENPKKTTDNKSIVIVKKDEESVEPQASPVEPQTIPVEPQEIPVKPVEENNSLKEIITVEKNFNDTETVDDFVNDLNAILEKKGEMIEKDTKKYTLFDDAIEEE